jgi:hypothetical protein
MRPLELGLEPVRQVAREAPAMRTSACLRGERQSMQRKKPDMLWVLVFLFGLGVVTTSYAQSFWPKPGDMPAVYSSQP